MRAFRTSFTESTEHNFYFRGRLLDDYFGFPVNILNVSLALSTINQFNHSYQKGLPEATTRSDFALKMVTNHQKIAKGQG